MAPQQHKPRKKSSSHIALQYAGLGFELLVLILIATWIGQKLDAKYETSDPYITIGMVLLSFALFFYRLIKQVSRD